MEQLKKVWKWVSEHALMLLSILVAILGAGLVFDNQRKKRWEAAARLAVENASLRASVADEKRKELERRDEVAKTSLKRLERARDAIRKESAGIVPNVKKMSNQDLASEIDRMVKKGAL